MFAPSSQIEATFSRFMLACYMSDVINGVMHPADAAEDLGQLTEQKLFLG